MNKLTSLHAHKLTDPQTLTTPKAHNPHVESHVEQLKSPQASNMPRNPSELYSPPNMKMLSLRTAAACSERWQGAPPSAQHSTFDHPQTADIADFVPSSIRYWCHSSLLVSNSLLVLPVCLVFSAAGVLVIS